MIEFCNIFLLRFPMKFTEGVAIYAAIVATIVAVWDVIKWRKGQAQVTLSCYLAKKVDKMVIPSGGRICDVAPDEMDRILPRFIMYNIKNSGGTPITIRSLGGKETDGKHFVISGNLLLPQTIQPGDSLSVHVPLGDTPEAICQFSVTDAIGREWCCTASSFQKQLKVYRQL